MLLPHCPGVLSHREYVHHLFRFIPEWDQSRTITPQPGVERMRKLTQDEASNKVSSVEGKVFTVQHTVKPDNDSPAKFELLWRFDFEGVTDEEVLLLAGKALTINKQRDWRVAKNQMDEEVWHDVTFRVRDMLDGARRKADPIAKARKLLDGMTAEQALALLREKVGEQEEITNDD